METIAYCGGFLMYGSITSDKERPLSGFNSFKWEIHEIVESANRDYLL